MPVIYQIDQAKGLIRTRCVGNVTFAEVMDHFSALARDPDCPRRLNVLLDLSESASSPGSAQLAAVAQAIGRIGDRVRFDACAIVAGADVLFGMARMFEVVAGEHFSVTRAFREVGEAETWLDSQRLPLTDR
jgi:hypothetical protein